MRDTPTMDLAAMRRRAEDARKASLSGPGSVGASIVLERDMPALLDLVERLGACLRETRLYTLADGSPCWCPHGEYRDSPKRWPMHSGYCQEARAALRAVGKGE